jgi:cell division protein FtsB
MRNLKHSRGGRNIMQSKVVLTLFAVFILFFAWSVLGFWNKMQDTAKNKKIAEDKVAALQKQKEKLSSDISNLKTDQGKEKVFRENFGLAKDGEDVIVVVDDKNTNPAPKPASSGFFSFFTNLFK